MKPEYQKRKNKRRGGRYSEGSQHFSSGSFFFILNERIKCENPAVNSVLMLSCPIIPVDLGKPFPIQTMFSLSLYSSFSLFLSPHLPVSSPPLVIFFNANEWGMSIRSSSFSLLSSRPPVVHVMIISSFQHRQLLSLSSFPNKSHGVQKGERETLIYVKIYMLEKQICLFSPSSLSSSPVSRFTPSLVTKACSISLIFIDMQILSQLKTPHLLISFIWGCES